MPSGGPWETPFAHFDAQGYPKWSSVGVIWVTFSRFGAANWKYGFQGRFFSDLGVAILLNPMAACA